MLLTPPDAFGCVEPGIYRSNMLQLANFVFIKTLGLKRVLILSPEKPARPVLTFLEENQIDLVRLSNGIA